MSICPKCMDVLPANARACACGWRVGGMVKASKDETDRLCQWNDHGYKCGRVGSISDSTNGAGPWYCPEHWWRLKGQVFADPLRKTSAQLDAEWLTEAKNFCYDRGLDSVAKQRDFSRHATRKIGQPERFDIAHWQAWSTETLSRPHANMVAIERAQEILKKHPVRQPGDDDEEVAA